MRLRDAAELVETAHDVPPVCAERASKRLLGILPIWDCLAHPLNTLVRDGNRAAAPPPFHTERD